MSDWKEDQMKMIGSEFLPAPQARWYAVHTRSRFERSVAEELTIKGVETYLPSVGEIHRWKDRKKEIQVPLFPGYLFTRIHDDSPSRLKVLRTSGTVQILGRGAEIEPVPDREIDALKQLLHSRATCFAHPFLREGAWVRVKYGPLEGVEGRLTRIKNASRLVLSVEMLSQSVATEIDAGDVEVMKPRFGDSRARAQRE